MLKLGALERSHAARHPKRALALTMLRQFGGELSDADEEILHRLYCTVRLANGGHMKTFPNRYPQLDDQIAEELDRRFSAGEPVRIHDMGASGAVTSLEMFHRLRGRQNLTVHASDFLDALLVVDVPGTGWQVVFDNQRRALQFIGYRMVISTTDEPRKYPINRAIRAFLMGWILPRAKQLLEAGSATRIEVWHPKARLEAATDPRFSLGYADIFNPMPEVYTMVRILNVCHRFPAAALPRLFTKVARTIAPGGLLVVGFRPMLNPLDASFFERSAGGFSLVRDIGAGFSDKDSVLEVGL